MFSGELDRLLLSELGQNLQHQGEWEIDPDHPLAKDCIFAWTAENPRRNAMVGRRQQSLRFNALDPTWTAFTPGGGRGGACAVFDGTGNQHGDFASGIDPSQGPGWTMLALAQNNNPDGHAFDIFSKNNGGSPFVDFNLRFQNNSFSQPGGWACDVRVAGGTNTVSFVTNDPIVSGQPYFFGSTYDGTTHTLYVDGKNLVTNSSTTGALLNDSSGTQRIGTNSATTGHGNLTGKIYLVFAWRRALTQAEVLSLTRNPRQMFRVATVAGALGMAPAVAGGDANFTLVAVSATGAAASFTPNVLFTLGAATSTGAVAGFTPNVLVPLGAVSATGAVQPFVFATDASPTLVAVTATGAAAAFTPNPSGVPGAVSSSGAVAGFALEVDGAFGSASSTGAASSFAANDNTPFGGVSGTGAAGGGTGDPGGVPGAVSATGVAADFTVSGATQTTAAAVGKVKKRAKRAKLRKHKYTFENGITVIASDEATARAIAGLGGTEARPVDIKVNAAPAPAPAPSNRVEKQEAPAPIAPDLEALAAMLHAESEEARLAEEEEFLKELLLTIAIAA